jgi:tRNA(fMet)-specific endonuclease VapC
LIILDTDHLTVLRYEDDSHYSRLTSRLDASPDQHIVTTVITMEEQMRGWLAEINRRREVRRQIIAYERLLRMVEFLSEWEIIRLDDRVADQFDRLRKSRVRIGSQDLKIASIAVVHNALLLSANLRDFRRVPGLRVENWLN